MDFSTAEALRAELFKVIFRSRLRPFIVHSATERDYLFAHTDQLPLTNIPFVRDIVPITTTKEVWENAKWQRIFLDVDDKRESSQTDLNLLLAKPKPDLPKKKLPVICLMHQTSGYCDSEDMLQRILSLTAKGFMVLTINARYHGDRQGDDLRGRGKERYLQALIEAWKKNDSSKPEENIYPFIYDTVADLITATDYLMTRSDVQTGQLGITGISLGAMHAWFGAAIDTRWTAIAPLIGIQSFGYAVDNDCAHARVESIPDVFYVAARDLGCNEVTCDVVRAVWKKICPGLMDVFDAPTTLALLSPRPTFICNGELDPRCPIAGVEYSLEQAHILAKQWTEEKWETDLKIYKDVGHEVTEEMWNDCVQFFVQLFQTNTD